jgi:hypothetical protein
MHTEGFSEFSARILLNATIINSKCLANLRYDVAHVIRDISVGSGRTLSNHTSSNCHLTDAVNKHNVTTAVESCGGKCQRETEKLPTGFEGLSKSGLANRFNGNTVTPDQNKSNAEIVSTPNFYEGSTPLSESESRVTTVNMQKKASDVDSIDGSEKTARYSQSQPTDETSACETRLTVKDLLKVRATHDSNIMTVMN